MLQGHLPDGQKLQNPQGEHRPGFDMTFSAPKSVSILVGLGATPELIKLHDEAVQYAVSQIEQEFAETRVYKDGKTQYEKTGNLLIATFRQPTSRAFDPALHTHCVTLNLTFLEGKARSLASDKTRTHGVVEQIQNHAHYCGMLYRQHLATSLKEAGFHLRLTGNGLFEIQGVPDEVLAEFSKRREDIERLMTEKGWSSAKSATLATLMTRDQKEEFPLDLLQANWRLRAQDLSFDAKAFMQERDKMIQTPKFTLLKDKLLSMFGKVTPHSISEKEAAHACVTVATEILSQRASMFTERALLYESLKHGLVYEKPISHQAILDAVHLAQQEQSLYQAICPDTHQSLLTTPWLLTMEAETIARIENNKGVVKSITTQLELQRFLNERKAVFEHPLTPSQNEAITALFLNKDRYLAIQGYAGTAKTTLLAEASILMKECGYCLRSMAVASSAANELQTKAGISSDVFPVVYQELKSAGTGSLSQTVFIVDEASMLSSPQGHALMKQIERTQARLILIGDRAQLPSVNNGRIFGLIQDYGIETSVMNDIVRQKNPELKAAVIATTRGDIQTALEKIEVHELATHHERVQWIAQKWLRLNPELRESTLLFAPTHKDRMTITSLIRNGLKQEGTLHQKAYIQGTLRPKPMEPIQQRFSAYYQKGDVVRFNQDFSKHAIQRQQYYTVAAISSKHRRDNILPLISAEGKSIYFALKSLPFYKTHTATSERLMEVYQSRELELHVGDKLMWTRNFKAENIRNGELIRLQTIENDKFIFINKENQSLSLSKNHPALQHLDYGYVMTNYKVQGKDAPYGIGLIESYHRFGATMKNFYVQISRAIHGMTLVTDNKQQLADAIQRNRDEKPAALDGISSQQLYAHMLRFKSFDRSLSLQPVIDKKIQFERKIEDLQFERVSQPELFMKELER